MFNKVKKCIKYLIEYSERDIIYYKPVFKGMVVIRSDKVNSNNNLNK
jgi:hypothetical protein